MHVLTSDSPLIVYIDVKSPYAFVAIRPTLALEIELGLQFDWRPLTLDIPSYLGSAQKKGGQVVASRGRSPRTWRAIRYSYMDARRYAERQGLVLKGTEKIWDSSIANIAILWVAARDRRAVRIRLTSAGLTTIDEAIKARLARAEQQLGVLPQNERKALSAALRKVLIGSVSDQQAA